MKKAPIFGEILQREVITDDTDWQILRLCNYNPAEYERIAEISTHMDIAAAYAAMAHDNYAE